MKLFRVALAVPQGLPFLERVLRGIADHARAAGTWKFTRLPEALGTSLAWLRDWSGDGAFVLAVTEADARLARRLPFPVVNLASHLPHPDLPLVTVDHRCIGELAAQHLLERRFQRFGYYGATGLWYSQLRRDGFRDAVRAAGGECVVLEASSGASARGTWRDQARQLEAWLGGLHPPVGVLASSDLRAGMVLDACRSLGRRVPEEVAVVGVDNDPVFAEFNDPPLTSVSRNDHEVGRQAAAMLARLMAPSRRRTASRAGRPVVLVPPDGIVTRGSTQTVAVDDPVIQKVLQYVRAHPGVPMRVPDLLKHAPVSRRAFEYRFRAALGQSPHEYLLRSRIAVAQQQLADPSRPKVSTVAASCGFSSPRRFRQVFARYVGQTPAAYRRGGKAAGGKAEGLKAEG